MPCSLAVISFFRAVTVGKQEGRRERLSGRALKPWQAAPAGEQCRASGAAIRRQLGLPYNMLHVNAIVRIH